MQETYVNSGGWFDIAVATGRTLYRLPRSLRERDEGTTHPTSLCAVYNDRWINPCSGAVIGQRDIAARLGRSVRQVQRSVFGTPLGASIPWVGDVPASNVKTLDIIREMLDTQARDVHLGALGVAVNSGSNIAAGAAQTTVNSASNLVTTPVTTPSRSKPI